MKKLILLALLLSASQSFAQSTMKSTGSLTAACTNATTTCDATAGSQLKLPVGEYSMASVTFHGTFTGVTVFFEFSDDGGTTWYPSTCTRNDAALQEISEALTDSTNRSFDCGTAGAGVFRVRLHAISTGTLLVGAAQSAIQIEPAPTVSVTGGAASGAAPVGNPTVVAGIQSATGFVRSLNADSLGNLSVVQASTGADAIVNTAGAIMTTGPATGLLFTANYAFNGASWDRLRGNTDGMFIGKNASDSDGVANTAAFPQANAAGGLKEYPAGFNGTTWDRARTASLSNLPTSQTLTARNSIGAQIAEKGSRFFATSAPAAGTAASASIAAEASVRHVVDCVGWSADSNGAVAATPLTVTIRDGATGAGTVMWQFAVAVPAGAGTGIQEVPTTLLCGLNLVGTTNTAMTVEFSAGVTNLLMTANFSGFNVN